MRSPANQDIPLSERPTLAPPVEKLALTIPLLCQRADHRAGVQTLFEKILIAELRATLRTRQRLRRDLARPGRDTHRI
jgi:hypothetical protein